MCLFCFPKRAITTFYSRSPSGFVDTGVIQGKFSRTRDWEFRVAGFHCTTRTVVCSDFVILSNLECTFKQLKACGKKQFYSHVHKRQYCFRCDVNWTWHAINLLVLVFLTNAAKLAQIQTASDMLAFLSMSLQKKVFLSSIFHTFLLATVLQYSFFQSISYS